MAEQLVTLFGSEIQKNLFPDNSFYKNSRLDGGIDVNAKTVEIPQSGAVPSVIVNPSAFPLSASQRVDDVKTYDVDAFATAPIHITDVNLMVINYDKRRDILEDHVSVLNTKIADIMAFRWAPLNASAARKLQTTGATRPSSYGGAAKKKATYEDFLALKELFDREDIPSDGRFLLVPSSMVKDMLEIDQFISFDYKDKAVARGVVGTILGFQVYERSRAVIYDDAFNKKESQDATTDRDAILAWHKSYVRRAEGNVKIYVDSDNPLYLGSIYNAQVRAGGTPGRNDEKGVAVLIQADFV